MTQITLRSVCLAYRGRWTMSVWRSSDTQQVRAMSSDYDHTERGISRGAIAAMWIIAAVIFVTIWVLSLL